MISSSFVALDTNSVSSALIGWVASSGHFASVYPSFTFNTGSLSSGKLTPSFTAKTVVPLSILVPSPAVKVTLW